MRLDWRALLPGLLILIFSSCFDNNQQYSVVPAIEFNNIYYKTGAAAGDEDTLVLTLKFKDGDGDLGLSATNSSDLDIPFNEKYYFKLTDGTYLNYKHKRTDPKYDTLPDFVPPFSCTNWEVVTDGNKTAPKIVDTVYFKLNPNHYNIWIDFYLKNNDGSFTKFDWNKFKTYPDCVAAGFNGRFPILSKDLSKKSPLEGLLTYNMKSLGFIYVFSIKTLKLKITVLDRALNRSNVLETPEFTLQSIKKN